MRPIDADALYLEKFVKPRTEWHQGWNDALDAATTQALTIDAVHVVRCKDCIYWSSKRSVCNNLRGLYSQTKETDFCSFGEMRDDAVETTARRLCGPEKVEPQMADVNEVLEVVANVLHESDPDGAEQIGILRAHRAIRLRYLDNQNPGK